MNLTSFCSYGQDSTVVYSSNELYFVDDMGVQYNCMPINSQTGYSAKYIQLLVNDDRIFQIEAVSLKDSSKITGYYRIIEDSLNNTSCWVKVLKWEKRSQYGIVEWEEFYEDDLSVRPKSFTIIVEDK